MVPLLTGALGFCVAWTVAPRPRDGELLEAMARQDSKLDALTARLARVQVLTEELQARAPAGAPSPPAVQATALVSSPPDTAEASPESLAALEQGRRLIGDAVAARRWGPPEVAELRRLMRDMTGPQRFEMVRQLSVAMNGGAIKGTLSSLVE